MQYLHLSSSYLNLKNTIKLHRNLSNIITKSEARTHKGQPGTWAAGHDAQAEGRGKQAALPRCAYAVGSWQRPAGAHSGVDTEG
jgi:hypothetical protein